MEVQGICETWVPPQLCSGLDVSIGGAQQPGMLPVGEPVMPL